MEGGEAKSKAKVATVTRNATKAEVTEKVKETAKDGGETSPTPPRVGGEATVRKDGATQANGKTEKSSKRRPKSSEKKVPAATATSRDTSTETNKRG
jgi:hypothetical protein